MPPLKSLLWILTFLIIFCKFLFQMEFQLFHFTRITGCKKILQNKERKWPQPKTWAEGIRQNLEYFLDHYQYLEETRKIRRKTIVILVPCDNCNEHKIDPKHCDFSPNT
jgi:hypothetical protein